MIDDPRFADEESRWVNNTELIDLFIEVFKTKTRDEWMEIFVEHELMFCSVQELEEVFFDPQVLANEYLVDFESPYVGQVKIPGYPVHFSANQAGTKNSAPSLGEHTDMVMREIGLSDKDIQDLKKEGVLR